MQIVVKTREDPIFGHLSEDRTMQISVDPTDTIGVVKSIIQEDWHIPLDQQTIKIPGLTDDEKGVISTSALELKYREQFEADMERADQAVRSPRFQV